MKQLFLSLILAGLFLSGLTGLEARMAKQNLTYRYGNKSFKGYMIWDASYATNRPGIILVHDWWGHNKFIRERANVLAGYGYTVLAVDMYGNGRQARSARQAFSFSRGVRRNMRKMEGRFKAALRILKRHSTVDSRRIGAVGYGFGGAVVLDMARRGIPLRGVVSFYGFLKTRYPARKGRILGRILAFHAVSDSYIPAREVSAFREEMRKARVRLEVVSYFAQHGFANPESTALGKKFNLRLRYNARAVTKSYYKVMHFFMEVFPQVTKLK